MTLKTGRFVATLSHARRERTLVSHSYELRVYKALVLPVYEALVLLVQ